MMQGQKSSPRTWPGRRNCVESIQDDENICIFNAEIIAQGTPEDIVRAARSYTGHFLWPVLGRRENKRKKGGQQAAE
jgi:hypothetical protein